MAAKFSTPSNRRFWIHVILSLTVLCYVLYHLLQGDRGWMAWRKLLSHHATACENLQELRQKEERLKHEILCLKDQSMDTELLAEYVLSRLNDAPPGTWMVLEDEHL